MYNMYMLSKKLINYLHNDSAFQQFQIHIEEEMAKLDSLKGLDKMNNKDAGETARARSLALHILQKIFDPIVTFHEKKDPTPEDIQQKKDQYGL